MNTSIRKHTRRPQTTWTPEQLLTETLLSAEKVISAYEHWMLNLSSENNLLVEENKRLQLLLNRYRQETLLPRKSSGGTSGDLPH